MNLFEDLSPLPSSNHYPVSPAIAILYNGTPQSSLASRLFVDFWVSVSGEEWMDESIPEDFLRDVLKSMFQQRPALKKAFPSVESPERYHVSAPAQADKEKD